MASKTTLSTAVSRRTKAARGRFDVVQGGVATSTSIDPREARLFRSLDTDNSRSVSRHDVERTLADVGLTADDRRLREGMAALIACEEATERTAEQAGSSGVPIAPFCKAIRHNITLIERALQGNLVIPDFAAFCRDLEEIYEASKANRSGEPADYIPQLNLVEPEVDRFGVALCTIDGQRFAIGDSGTSFPVESTCKPVNYCMALEEHGEAIVHSHIGHEPSGASFNELALNKDGRPHNPMINAGAIMSSALIGRGERRDAERKGSQSDEMAARGWAGNRFDRVASRWQSLCGGQKPGFNNSVYLSERQTADRNFALAYFMREKGAFPADVDLQDVLDFYLQCCSIEADTEMMSVLAATLANGGICPITGERVFATETVQSCLSLMSSCGMYDFSGEFAFTIGLPAKSGVSGAILIVIPNVMGICTWSPRLDEHGNSVRGIEFSRRLVETFNFHNYDNLTGTSTKKDPRISRIRMQAVMVNELIWAASKGDLGAMQDQVLRGADLSCADYDLRTPLHLAAAQNQENVVRFFIEQKELGEHEIELNPRDRWGGTPLDDARLHGNDVIVGLLEKAGGRRGQAPSPQPSSLAPVTATPQAESHHAAELIWAASEGDLGAIRRLVARGVALDIADYDLRTPLHLAAAEGHVAVVRYFIDHDVDPAPLDRWGNTPIDDAERHGRQEVVKVLQQAGGRSGVDVVKQSRDGAAAA